MTRKQLALSLVLATLLVASAIYAQDLITPNTAEKDIAVSFTYYGQGTVDEWCFKKLDAPRWTCQGKNNIKSFSSSGTWGVQVRGKVGAVPFDWAEAVNVTE